MKEYIRIKNFGGVQDISIELKQLNIFIGPQGSGKSITVKLIYFCKNILNDLVHSVLDQKDIKSFKKEQLDNFIKFFPKDSWCNGEFAIQYKLNDIEISLNKDRNDKLKLEFSYSLKKLINKTRNYYKGYINRAENIKEEERRFFLDFEVNREVKSYFAQLIYNHQNEELGSQIFIPAGRSFFANLQANIFSFLSANQNLDPFLVEFGSIYERFKNISSSRTIIKQKANPTLDKIFHEILNSSYLREKNKDYLIHSDKRKVNLSNASSGQQEILPLIVILKLILTRRVSLENKSSLYIEEPEAHLFPTAQYNVVKLLARLCNTRGNNYQIFITTHSPYLLTSFNNLFYAGHIIKQNNSKQGDIYKLIDKEEIILGENVTAYSLINGQHANLIDKNDDLISATVLDKVSEDIGIKFENLLNIEYSDNFSGE